MSEPDEKSSVLDVIEDVKRGQTDAKSLPPADRQACVAYLSMEGMSAPEIARVLKCSDRTILRDRKAIRDELALHPDPALPARMAGQLLAEAENCIARIRRVTRDRETPANVRVDGERACFAIVSELVQRLQSLGFLPSAAHRLEASIAHQFADAPELGDLCKEVQHLAEVCADVYGAKHDMVALTTALGQATAKACRLQGGTDDESAD